MGEGKLHLGTEGGSAEKRAVQLKNEIAAIRERLSEDIAELDRRRHVTVAKAKHYSVAATAAAVGVGALLISALFAALRKPATKQ
jgi:hypothetical protein